jgi:hypothetical protein
MSPVVGPGRKVPTAVPLHPRLVAACASSGAMATAHLRGGLRRTVAPSPTRSSRTGGQSEVRAQHTSGGCSIFRDSSRPWEPLVDDAQGGTQPLPLAAGGLPGRLHTSAARGGSFSIELAGKTPSDCAGRRRGRSELAGDTEALAASLPRTGRSTPSSRRTRSSATIPPPSTATREAVSTERGGSVLEELFRR